MPLNSITSVKAIENIRMGIKRGRVKTLVIESLLFLETVKEEVIDEIKTILSKDRESNKLMGIK